MAIQNATDNSVRFIIDQHRHPREEEANNFTLNIHVGDIHIAKQVDPLIIREREISEELKELNVDYAMLVEWLVKCSLVP